MPNGDPRDAFPYPTLTLMIVLLDVRMIEKRVPWDHRLLSLGKPRDAKRRS